MQTNGQISIAHRFDGLATEAESILLRTALLVLFIRELLKTLQIEWATELGVLGWFPMHLYHK